MSGEQAKPTLGLYDAIGAAAVVDGPDGVECCCTAENGGTYCGQPECDIYYCHDCGDEFSEPCPRHEGVNHA